MGIFQVTFAALAAPTYDDNNKTQTLPCDDDVQPRTVVFDGVGDYVVGLNYNGDTPATLRILSFTDELFYSDTLGGPLIQDMTYVPSEIEDGGPITFPYDKAIGDLSDFTFTNGGGEMPCNFEKYDNIRKRVIEYTILDVNGAQGSIRVSTLTTIGAS